MELLFLKAWENIADSYRGKNLRWHIIAITTTYMLVASGFDWNYYQFFLGSPIYYFAFTTAAIGGLIPILAPVILLVYGKIRRSPKLTITAFAIAQSAIIGSIISSLYKAFTGRFHPSIAELSHIDISHVFQFGFLRGGIFWGWPSSHTTIAFAMVATLWALYPKNKFIKIISMIYAFYIGIGVSMTIHWFSDFVAGAIIGTVIGLVVGKAFLHKIKLSPHND